MCKMGGTKGCQKVGVLGDLWVVWLFGLEGLLGGGGESTWLFFYTLIPRLQKVSETKNYGFQCIIKGIYLNY